MRTHSLQVTGKTKVEYFFDPTLALPPDHSGDNNFETPAKSSTIPRSTPAAATSSILRLRSIGSDEIDDSVLFASRHLFMPCTIVKDIESTTTDDDEDNTTTNNKCGTNLALVKTSDGQLHKIRNRNQLIPLTSPEDYIGVPDVLHLPNVT